MLISLLLAAAIADPTLSPEGYGWLRTDMTAAEAAAASQEPLKAVYLEDPDACEAYWVGDTGVQFMTQGGKVSRVTVTEPGPRTESGIGIGDPESRIFDAFGDRVEREPSAYAEPPAHDLYVWISPGQGYRFEINNFGKVITIHAGTETIRYMEGCL